jgi:transglutaminase-like putative cysteine protease
LAALLRVAGIPSGLCYQLLRYNTPSDPLIVHGLNGVYLKDIGRWVRVDPRGNKVGVNAQFCIEHEQLAFTPNQAYGEFTCRKIFVEPLPNTLACLKRCKTVTDLLANLPRTIDFDKR